METTPPCVSLLSRAAGLALLATTALLPAAAPAQEASDILGAVLRGLTQTPESDRELVERAARACARQAADRDLEVRRGVGAPRPRPKKKEGGKRVDERRSANTGQ